MADVPGFDDRSSEGDDPKKPGLAADQVPSFFLVYSIRPPASMMPMTECGQREELEDAAAGDDLAARKIDLHLVPRLERVRRLLALEHGQAQG